MKIQKIQNQLLAICLAVGFFIGIVYENLASSQQLILENFTQMLRTEVIASEYLWYVVKLRCIPLALLLLAGTLRIKKMVSVLMVVWTGFLAGVFMVGAVIRMGVKGILFSFVSMFPHMIFYGCAYGMLLVYLLHYPRRQWNVAKTIFVVLTFALGIVLEAYVNPIFLRLFVKYLG